VRAAWVKLLNKWLPAKPASVLDIGCGTGSLSLLLASLGHQVMGIDISEQMLVRAEAKAKAAGQSILFRLMDAYNPDLPHSSFDVIVCRHLLWAMPSPAEALRRWSMLLVPGGRLLLIEGFWHTGGGLHALQIIDALPPELTAVQIEDLSSNSNLWGQAVRDERYLITAKRQRTTIKEDDHEL
jgi:ubiquinone/menaquinone biosynthesis C-methylase UbiE